MRPAEDEEASLKSAGKPTLPVVSTFCVEDFRDVSTYFMLEGYPSFTSQNVGRCSTGFAEFL